MTYLLGATSAPSLVLIKWRGQKRLSGQHTGYKRDVWPWPLNMWPESIGIIYSLRATLAPSLVLIKWRGQKILSGQHSGLRRVGWEELFDHDLWTCDLKINRDHLLIECNPCTKFGIDQVKGSKDIERTTLGLQTDRPKEWPTDQPTVAKQYVPFFKGDYKNTNVE